MSLHQQHAWSWNAFLETVVFAGSICFVSELGFNDIEKWSENKNRSCLCGSVLFPVPPTGPGRSRLSGSIGSTNDGASGFVKSSDAETVLVGFLRKEAPKNARRELQR